MYGMIGGDVLLQGVVGAGGALTIMCDRRRLRSCPVLPVMSRPATARAAIIWSRSTDAIGLKRGLEGEGAREMQAEECKLEKRQAVGDFFQTSTLFQAHASLHVRVWLPLLSLRRL